MIEEVLMYRGKYFDEHESVYKLFWHHQSIIKRSQSNTLDPYPYKTVKTI